MTGELLGVLRRKLEHVHFLDADEVSACDLTVSMF